MNSTTQATMTAPIFAAVGTTVQCPLQWQHRYEPEELRGEVEGPTRDRCPPSVNPPRSSYPFVSSTSHNTPPSRRPYVYTSSTPATCLSSSMPINSFSPPVTVSQKRPSLTRPGAAPLLSPKNHLSRSGGVASSQYDVYVPSPNVSSACSNTLQRVPFSASTTGALHTASELSGVLPDSYFVPSTAPRYSLPSRVISVDNSPAVRPNGRAANGIKPVLPTAESSDCISGCHRSLPATKIAAGGETKPRDGSVLNKELINCNGSTAITSTFEPAQQPQGASFAFGAPRLHADRGEVNSVAAAAMPKREIPFNVDEPHTVVQGITPRFAHSNGAVDTATVKEVVQNPLGSTVAKTAAAASVDYRIATMPSHHHTPTTVTVGLEERGPHVGIVGGVGAAASPSASPCGYRFTAFGDLGDSRGLPTATCGKNSPKPFFAEGTVETTAIGPAEQLEELKGADIDPFVESVVLSVSYAYKLTPVETQEVVKALHCNFIRSMCALRASVAHARLHSVLHPVVADAVSDLLQTDDRFLASDEDLSDKVVNDVEDTGSVADPKRTAEDIADRQLSTAGTTATTQANSTAQLVDGSGQNDVHSDVDDEIEDEEIAEKSRGIDCDTLDLCQTEIDGGGDNDDTLSELPNDVRGSRCKCAPTSPCRGYDPFTSPLVKRNSSKCARLPSVELRHKCNSHQFGLLQKMKSRDTVLSRKRGKRFELVRNKEWVVENCFGGENVCIDEADLRHNVSVRDCSGDCLVKVVKKINNAYIDRCQRTNVILQSLLGSVELINSDRIKVQIIGRCPNITLDSCNAVTMYLSEQSRDVMINTSKCSEINLVFPSVDDSNDFVEVPLPEQYETHIENNKLVTHPALWYQ